MTFRLKPDATPHMNDPHRSQENVSLACSDGAA
jgi:hypothetical protein